MALRGSVGGTMGLLLGETLSGFSKAPPCSAGGQKLPPPHPQATGLKVKKTQKPTFIVNHCCAGFVVLFSNKLFSRDPPGRVCWPGGWAGARRGGRQG